MLLHTYRLVYPFSAHAPPQIWEYAQPYIDHLILNARTFHRQIVQWYFEDWGALDQDNTRIWNTYYRIKPLYDHLPTWQDWLPDYRQLIIEVQEMVEEHIACGTWQKGCVPPSTHGALNKVSRLMMLMVVGASRDIMPKAAF